MKTVIRILLTQLETVNTLLLTKLNLVLLYFWQNLVCYYYVIDTIKNVIAIIDKITIIIRLHYSIDMIKAMNIKDRRGNLKLIDGIF